MEVADRDVADAKRRLAEAEERAASARAKLQRVSSIQAQYRSRGEALFKKCEQLRSAIPKVEGNPEIDEDFLNRLDAIVARALAVVVGADI